MDNYKYIGFIGVLVATAFFYQKILKSENKDKSKYYLDMIQKYLLVNNSLGIRDKPFLWIHMHNDTALIPDVNQRNWVNFHSRNTKDLNQPYQELTLKSIINKCGNDFNIGLINDYTFDKIIPNWKLDLSRVSGTIKMNLRHLAISTILSIYGGMFIPSSFICFKSLNSIYEKYTSNNDMFITEFPNKTGTNTCNNLLASTEIIGCKANSVNMKKYLKHLEILYSSDFGMEAEFLGKNNAWLSNEINNNNINLIQARYFGICDVDGDIIELSDLISCNKNIKLDPDSCGVYIPWNDVINRTQFQWFAQLSPTEVLKSNTNISKYLLLCEA